MSENEDTGLRRVLGLAEDLKCELWHYMEVSKKVDQSIKDKMNELLDMLDNLKDLDP